MPLRNIFSTSGLARASARRPWRVVGLWLGALAVAAALIVTLLPGALTTGFDFSNDPESKRATLLMEEKLTGSSAGQEIVIVQSRALTVDDPAFRAHVQSLFAQLMGLGDSVVRSGFNYYLTGEPSLVSADRHTTIIYLSFAGTVDEAAKNIDGLMGIVRSANGEGGFNTYIVGDASLSKDWREVADKDMQREAWGIAAALVVLLGIFAAVVASVVPFVLAVFSIAVALGLTALIGQSFQFSFFVTNMITMMGLAVGIDYSLFILSRFREERHRGLDKLEAIASAGRTASRAVFFSGMTVVVALAGMLIVPSSVFQSLAGGAILVVLASVLASLTLLPAILSLLGDRVNALRLPLVGRKLGAGGDNRGGFWDAAARLVMRRPVLSLALTGGLLSVTAIPAFGLNIGMADFSTLPDSVESKAPFRILADEFAEGMVSPAQIVISGDVGSPEVQAGVQRLTASLVGDPSFKGGYTLTPAPGGDMALISVPLAQSVTDELSIQGVRALRERLIPEAFSGVSAEVMVTGPTAFWLDFFDQVNRYTPIVFAFVLGVSFLLLMVVFRSLVVPIKAIIMNLLSVGAAYGLMVLVFEKGVGAGVLGFQQIDTVEAWIPLFLFSVLFGLSMDYHVFLLSRIREHFDKTGRNDESVSFGLRATASIITGAALIMVAVFAGFASGELVMFQQVGFGLAVAVLLDATIVRSVLVPATMRLLGNRNWYLPRFLHWLPDVRAGH